MPNSMRWAGILAIGATVAYCWAIWWFAGLFSVLVPEGGASGASVVLLAPLPGAFCLHSIHWQALALVSLALALKSTFRNSPMVSPRESALTPLLGHAFYLLLVCCLHVVGLLISVLPMGAVIE